MSDLKCVLCGLPYKPYPSADGGSIELAATPTRYGTWALRNGAPVSAVAFEEGKVIGRLPGFESDPLYPSHYRECARAQERHRKQKAETK